MVSLETMVPRDHPDHLALPHHGSSSLHQLDAVCAHQVLVDPPAHRDHLAHLAPRACPDKLAGQATMDAQDHSAMLDPLAKLAGQAALDPRETTDVMWKLSLLDHQDLLENLDKTAHLDHLVKLAGPVMLDHPDPVDHLDHLAGMARLEARVIPAPRESLDHLARTPPTVPAQGAPKPPPRPRRNQHHQSHMTLNMRRTSLMKMDYEGFIVLAFGLLFSTRTKW